MAQTSTRLSARPCDANRHSRVTESSAWAGTTRKERHGAGLEEEFAQPSSACKIQNRVREKQAAVKTERQGELRPEDSTTRVYILGNWGKYIYTAEHGARL